MDFVLHIVATTLGRDLFVAGMNKKNMCGNFCKE